MRVPRTIVSVVMATLAMLIVPIPPSTAAAATAAMPSDFNGDDFADLAIGVPGENDWAGAVNVLYGSANGLTASGDQYWTQDTPGVKGTSRGGFPSDAFGAALASGDFDRDGFADLAIGVPDDSATESGDIDLSQRDIYPGGAVNILYGSASGLTADGDQRWTRGTVTKLGFGWDKVLALAAGDFDADGYWDLGIGQVVYDRELTGDIDDGDLVYRLGVTFLYGGPTGLTTAGATGWLSPTLGYDSCCWMSLAAGDLDADGLSDLAVGNAQTAADSNSVAEGAVDVLYGTPSGITSQGSQRWTQDSPGVDDDAEPGDSFGSSLAIGDFDADGVGDLAIGARGESGPTTPSAGATHVLYGSETGLTAAGTQFWHEGSPGIPGGSDVVQDFGAALAAGDLDGDGADDLAIGVSGDRPTADDPRGAVVTLYGGSDGLSATGAQSWTQDSPGVPGTMETGDWTGLNLAIANYGHAPDGDLAIGAVEEDIGARQGAGMVNVLYGRAAGLSGIDAQGWSQNTAGVRGTAETYDGFGGSLTP